MLHPPRRIVGLRTAWRLGQEFDRHRLADR